MKCAQFGTRTGLLPLQTLGSPCFQRPSGPERRNAKHTEKEKYSQREHVITDQMLSSFSAPNPFE